MNLTELARLAIDRGVFVHIGCAKRDVGKAPPIITVQVSDNSAREPRNFSMEVSSLNPGAELALEVATRKLIDDFSNRKHGLHLVK